MESHRLYTQILMICAVAGCLLVVAASADDTIPSFTGNFDVFGFLNFGTGVNSVSLTGPSTLGMDFSPPANLTSQTTVTCTPQGCTTQTLWNGSAIGGTVDMFADIGVQSISMGLSG